MRLVNRQERRFRASVGEYHDGELQDVRICLGFSVLTSEISQLRSELNERQLVFVLVPTTQSNSHIITYGDKTSDFVALLIEFTWCMHSFSYPPPSGN